MITLSPKKNIEACGVLGAKRPASGCAVRPKAIVRSASTPVPSDQSQRAIRFFLNSYHPLCETEQGRAVAAQHRIPPFVDYSIRREPDFQHPFPSITGLCRCDLLVGRAEEGDFIAYVTVKSAGPRRLVAILQVLHKMPTHAAAADWYRREGLDLPTNCVVPGNDALPISLAVPPNSFTTYAAWKAGYRWRSEHYPSFLICRAVGGPELVNPPLVPEGIFGALFPNTRSPKHLTKAEFAKLRRLLP